MKTALIKLCIQFITILLLMTSGELISQEYASNSVKKRQKELEKINKSIKDTRKKLNTLTKQERSTVKELNINQKHSVEVSRYINLLDEQISDVQTEISKQDSVYYGLSYKLRRMISEYASLAREIYLEGSTSDAEVVFTSQSFDDDLKRDFYTVQMSEHFKANMNKINLMRVAVSNEAGMLRDKSDYQTELKDTKKREQQYLAFSIGKNKRILNKIKSDSKELQKQLADKTRSAEKLRNIIADLIRKEPGKKSTATNKPGPIKELPIGKMSWPIESRKIFRGYGEQKNKETNTIFENPGIDISASAGTSVKTVADGEVSMVHWLPGYGTLVILNHGNSLRSVYANLSSVFVKKGDKVAKGNSIGKTGESVDGEFLHFELWQGSRRLNPSHYLQ